MENEKQPTDIPAQDAASEITAALRAAMDLIEAQAARLAALEAALPAMQAEIGKLGQAVQNHQRMFEALAGQPAPAKPKILN